MFKESNFYTIPEEIVVEVLQNIFSYMENPEACIDDDYVKMQIEYSKSFIVKEDI